ncbi:MAG: lipase family protein [Planctomycetales bacterium]|nr:lipase family protein [Planctomycetales bacterium]
MGVLTKQIRPPERPVEMEGDELPHRWRSTPLTGPLQDLSFWRQALLLAELADISYYVEPIAVRLGAEIGLPNVRYLDRDGAQAYFFSNEHDTIVVCRGTEAREWNDIKADVNALMALAETAGRVHRGFKREVDDLWPLVEEVLENNAKELWFTGHSLGGAMAAICAGRCQLSRVESNPAGLHTFGSPRVGNKAYVNYVQLPHWRWVNNNDIVTRVPPPWMGYRHAGKEMYLNANGKLRRLTGWQRTKDRLRGFLRGVRQWRIDHFSDHMQINYINYLAEIVAADEAGEDVSRKAKRLSTRVKERLQRSQA